MILRRLICILFLSFFFTGCGTPAPKPQPKPQPITAPDSIKIMPSSVTLTVGQQFQLSVIGYSLAGPANYTNTATWSVSDASLSLDPATPGLVTALEPGIVTVTAILPGDGQTQTFDNETLTATATVTIIRQ